MDKLQFKQTRRPRRTEFKPKSPVFGADPSTLKTEEDNGFQVPRVLVLLRANLYFAKGLENEGIFRLAGNETVMKEMKLALNTDHFGPDDFVQDPHSVASLIKRWFGELPQRIFSSVSSAQITAACQPDGGQLAVDIVHSLPEPQKSLFGWLSTLLVETALLHETNKMTPSNLSIVVGPSMVDFPAGNPLEGLALSQRVVGLVQHWLLHKLLEDHAITAYQFQHKVSQVKF